MFAQRLNTNVFSVVHGSSTLYARLDEAGQKTRLRPMPVNASSIHKENITISGVAKGLVT